VRVLVDSSVIVAAVARPGVCTQFLDELVDGHVWLVSDFILDEVARKLREKFNIPQAVIAETIDRFTKLGERVEAAVIPSGECRDPEDIPILGAAVGGDADLLVTVDKDLLELRAFRGIPIVKPGEAFRRLRGSP